MKNIKELGLEVIKLEDQVLLVKDDWQEIPYIKNAKDDKVYMIAKEKIALEILSVPVKNCPQVIASTKPLEGLPLLMIEDEVEILAEHSSEVQEATYTTQHKITYKDGFRDGYNKAKETYKFTEDDLRNALSESFKASQEGYQITSDEIIQSLTKKELWIEIEDKIAIDGHTIIGVEPKITDGKIKGIWK